MLTWHIRLWARVIMGNLSLQLHSLIHCKMWCTAFSCSFLLETLFTFSAICATIDLVWDQTTHAPHMHQWPLGTHDPLAGSPVILLRPLLVATNHCRSGTMNKFCFGVADPVVQPSQFGPLESQSDPYLAQLSCFQHITKVVHQLYIISLTHNLALYPNCPYLSSNGPCRLAIVSSHQHNFQTHVDQCVDCQLSFRFHCVCDGYHRTQNIYAQIEIL